MNNLVKKLLLWIFIISILILFIGFTVFIIITARGGKLTPNGIESTGIIHIDTELKDIDVFVDGKKVNLKNKNIENLSIGEHKIEVTKEGFLPWTKSVIVEEGIVKNLYINLFPESLSLEQITSTNIDNIAFSPYGDLAIYTVLNSEKEDEKGIWKLKLTKSTFDFRENKPEKLFSLNEDLKNIFAEKYEIKISPNNQRFIISTSNNQLLFSISEKNYFSLDNINKIGFKFNKVDWYKQGDSLILEKNNTLFEYDISDNITMLIHDFEDNKIIYSINGDEILFFAQEKYYVYKNRKKELLDTKLTLPKAKSIYLNNKHSNLLYIVSSEDKLYFIDFKVKYIKEIGDLQIITTSSSGHSAILKNNNNQIFLFINDYIPAKNEIRTELIKLTDTYDEKNDFYTFSSYNNQVLYKSQKSGKSTIYLYDFYGINKFKLIETEFMNDNKFSLSNDDRDFYTLLLDAENEQKIYNLYKIHLLD